MEQGVEGVEAGDARGRVRPRIEPPTAGEPAEAVEADVERDQRDPERRHRDAGERGDAQSVVGRPVASQARDHAERDPDDRREEDREDRELDRGGDELAEVVRDGVVGERRLAEIALHEMLEVDQVTDRERLVEPVVLIERLHRRGIRGCLLAEVRRGGVARNELCEDEGDEGDPEQEQDQRGQPAQEEEKERSARPEAGASPHRQDRLGFRGGCHPRTSSPARSSEAREGRSIRRYGSFAPCSRPAVPAPPPTSSSSAPGYRPLDRLPPRRAWSARRRPRPDRSRRRSMASNDPCPDERSARLQLVVLPHLVGGVYDGTRSPHHLGSPHAEQLPRQPPADRNRPGLLEPMANWGGITVAFERPTGPGRLSIVKGLPNDRCQAPHWGYLSSRTMIVSTATGSRRSGRRGLLRAAGPQDHLRPTAKPLVHAHRRAHRPTRLARRNFTAFATPFPHLLPHSIPPCHATDRRTTVYGSRSATTRADGIEQNHETSRSTSASTPCRR